MGYGGNKRYVLGVDIGGTKIDAQLFQVRNGGLSYDSAWAMEQPACKGVQAHIEQVADVIAAAARQASSMGGTLAGIGIGSPGRFDASGKIKAGTNPNLGRAVNEFDGVDLRSEYRDVLGKSAPTLAATPLYVSNDGDAMLAGMLEAIQKNKAGELRDQHGNTITRHGLCRKHVALFGIGTGVGHAVAAVGDAGEFAFVTDGHASKLRVKVDDADMGFLLEAKKRMETSGGKTEVLAFDDNTVRAEDLFRGPVIQALAGMDNGKRFDGRQLGALSPQQEAALRFAGKYMARTIALIRNGESEDVEPANGWSAQDKVEAAKTGIYLVGGGMGRSAIGKAIIRHAGEELERLGIRDVQLVQVPGDNVAARAAAALVPESVYRPSPQMGC